MASKFGFAIYGVILIVIVVSFCNIISLSGLAIEPVVSKAGNFLEKNNTYSTDELLRDLKRDHKVFSFDEYYNLTQINNYMNYLQHKYKNFVQVFPIGQTWEGRTIRTLKISSGNANNSAFWIDGGIHAREWIAVSSVLFLTNVLVTNWLDLDPVFRNVDYYITPVLNPDGYAFSHTEDNRWWRRNRRKMGLCYGVDLNRNFPYKWNEFKTNLLESAGIEFTNMSQSPDCSSDEYPGLAPSSELETRAVINFITGFPANKFKGFLSFHTYGKYILYPYGYDHRMPKNFIKLFSVGQTAADKIFNVTEEKYKVFTGSSLYLFPGNSIDWAYKVAKIPLSYLVELRDNLSFDLPPSEIVPAGKEALIIAMTIVDNFDSSAETPKSIPVVPADWNYENIVIESDND
ncbi:carboxypeptidase B-like isoform X2 [Planococcus citri]|uniref:carboxypeptidase B-like isoform X2 n=1 Tax=Planococcus citri TaxID=170843 RepID=UPI0031F87FFF